jgi:hypothetical protein
VSKNNIWVGPFKNGECIFCGASDLHGCLANRKVHWVMRGKGIEDAKRREREDQAKKLAEGAADNG